MSACIYIRRTNDLCRVFFHGAFLRLYSDVRCGRRVGTYESGMHLFFLHGANMINAAIILEAEKDLFNSVLNRDFSHNIKTDIQKIIEVYIQG